MKKLSNFAWLLAAMLSATTLTACGDNNNDVQHENISSANVSESLTQVFTSGMAILFQEMLKDRYIS